MIKRKRWSRPKRTLISPLASTAAVAAVMRGNKKKNSRPELAVRRALTRLGYRYRLHARDLPGNPDIVFRGRRKLIFVHGCFWHQHQNVHCPLRSHPKSNIDYWGPKLRRNGERDEKNRRILRNLGWSVLIIWECQLKSAANLDTRLEGFLSLSPRP